VGATATPRRQRARLLTQPSRPTSPSAGDQRAEPTPRSTGTNDLLAFLTFVEHHKPGSSVNAIVENYSSHGAYVRIGDVKGYVPLSLMSDPPPRSAREFMKIGESITLVVESFAPARRSIDLAIPTMTTVKPPPADTPGSQAKRPLPESPPPRPRPHGAGRDRGRGDRGGANSASDPRRRLP
jgi:transcriptional accessory protein Tex/SPT6